MTYKHVILKILVLPLALLVWMGTTGSYASAEPTRLVVRAQALDGKFLGTSIGGALIVVKDADTGRILAKGFTEGSTGNTGLIMQTPRSRETSITEGAAKFETVIDIDEPTFVTIEVYGPYLKKQARVAAQTQLWLIPGKHIEGDGITVQIPGFIVDALSPQTHHYMGEDERPVQIRANIVMMCGCVIEKGGIWNSDNYEIKALIKKDGKMIDEIPLTYVRTNTFEATYQPEENGPYEVIIYAYDPRTGNTGVDKTSFIIN